jgi:hypothetical protein
VGPVALRLDALGRVQMAHSLLSLDAVVIHEALLADGTWRTTTAALEGASTLSMAAAPRGASDSLHIVYESFRFETIYLRGAASGWTRENLGGSRATTGLALEGPSVAHLVNTDFQFPGSTILEYSTNRLLHPDGIDHNCDGVDGVDQDGDGEASLRTGGQDCDDRDPKIRACAAGSP